MASSSPNLNLHLSPEWMRAGQSATTSSKHTSSTNLSHAAVVAAGASNGLVSPTNGTSTSVGASTGTSTTSNAVNGASTPNGLPPNHGQPTISTSTGGLLTPAPTGMSPVTSLNVTPLSAYSSLLTPAATTQGARLSPNSSKDPSTDFHDPFRYTKDDILTIWRSGASTADGSGWSLGIEVERHDGVVIDLERIPSCTREMTEAEIKVYSAPSLNSRRPSLSHTHSHNPGRGSLDRDGEPVGLGILGRRGTSGDSSMMPPGAMRGTLGGGSISPLRERFPRRDSAGVSQPYRPRQLSAVTTPVLDGAPPLISPRATSGGFGFGGGPGFDSVLSAGEGWGGRKRGALAGAGRQGSYLKEIQEKAGTRDTTDGSKSDGDKDQQPRHLDGTTGQLDRDGDVGLDDKGHPHGLREEPAFENWEDDPDIATNGDNVAGQDGHGTDPIVNGVASVDEAKERTPNPAEVTWQYLDDQQVKQGPFTPQQLSAWDASGWLRPDLRMYRPDYDNIFIPFAEWKSKLRALGIADQKQVFYTWYDPVREASATKALEPPPGLAMPVQPQEAHESERKQSPEQTSASEEAGTSTEAPSVFDALRKADVNTSTTATSSPFHKGTHTPSSVFGSTAADVVFTHSPMSTHRLPIRQGTLETSSSSPASIHAAINGDSPFGHPGLGAARLQQFNTLHTQLPPSGSSIFNTLNYSPHNTLPPVLTRSALQGIASPLTGYGGTGSPYTGMVDPAGPNVSSPYAISQNGSQYGNSAFRQGSFDQQSSTSAPWQAYRTNLAAGSGLPARTGSSASSQSNNHRASFGGRRSASPAGIVGSLGGEIYDGVIGSAVSNAIGRNGVGAIPANHSPQQLYGTLYRTPVQPIPEASPLQPDAVVPLNPLSYSLQQENGLLRQSALNDQPIPIAGFASEEPLNTTSDVWSARPPASRSNSVWNIPTQPSDVPASDPSTNEKLSLSTAVGQYAKGKGSRKRETSNESTAAPKDPILPSSTSTLELEQDNGLPFLPVKKRTSATHSSSAQPTAVQANIGAPTSATVASPVAAPSKMTVPLVSLITNPPSTTNQNSATPAPKAWATVPVKEEGKSLKEIQEAEERRARESQKPKNTTIVSMASSTGGAKDDEVATLTWGLPTSLVGTRGAASKDSTSPITNSAPVVWANAAKVVAGTGPKKALTMKDIQEEEERRKQREKELATTARRVGEKKAAPPATSPAASTGTWSTVGPSGKAARSSTASSVTTTPTGIAALPPRPSAAAIASSGMRASHVATAASTMNATPAGAAANRRPNTASASGNTATKSSNADDSAHGVSADTLKWMRDTLRGRLSKGITVDEVVGLVLMMQEEDDIADTIYQSSTTLPGKRFAAEFIEKRNADRKSGNSTTFSASRSTAAASVSNTDTAAAGVPSAASQDALGYKVVKKKGKGGKA